MAGSSSIALLAALTLAASAGARDWRGHARIDGRVTDESGDPLPGATVALARLSSDKGPRVMCDAAGRWTVDGLAAGSWMIAVAAPGYRTARVGVHLPTESSWLAPVEVILDRERSVSPPEAEGLGPEAEGLGPGTRHADVRDALAAGRVDRARQLVSALAKDDAGATAVLVEVGAALLATGETVDAVACFDAVLERDPAPVDAHYRRALGLLALGRHAEARRDFEAVLEREPDGPLAAKARLALDELPAE